MSQAEIALKCIYNSYSLYYQVKPKISDHSLKIPFLNKGLWALFTMERRLVLSCRKGGSKEGGTSIEPGLKEFLFDM